MQEIYALAEDSAGSAMEEQERYLQGIQYQIDSFRASVEAFANDTMSSDFLKGVIAGAREFVDILDVILDKLGAFPVLAGAIGTAFSAKGMGITGSKLQDLLGLSSSKSTESLITVISDKEMQALKDFNASLDFGIPYADAYNKSIKGVSEAIETYAQSLKGVTKGSRDFCKEYVDLTEANNELNISQLASSHSLSDTSELLKHYNKNLIGDDEATKKFTASIDSNNHTLAAYIASLDGAKGSLMGYLEFAGMATLQTMALQAAAMALQMVLSMLVAFVVTKVISAINDYIHANEKLIEKGEEAKKVIEDITSSMKNQQKVLSDSAKRFAILSQEVDEVSGKNISLSDEEYQEFLDISNELAEVFPSLSYHYDENNNKIVKLNGSVSDITSSLEDLLRVEKDLARQKILENMDDVFNGAMASAKNTTKEIDKLETSISTLESSIENVRVTLDTNSRVQVSSDRVDDFEEDLKRIGIIYQKYLSAYGSDVYFSFDKQALTDEVKEQIISIYENSLTDIQHELFQLQKSRQNSMSSTLSEGIAAWLYSDWDYANLDEGLQANIQNLINNLDWNALDFSNWEEAELFLDKLIGDIGENENNFNALFDLGTRFNNGEITWGDFQTKVSELLNIIDLLDFGDTTKNEELKKSFKVLFDIETDEDGNVINETVNNLKEQVSDALKDDKASFTVDELIGGLGKDTIDKLQGRRINWSEILDLNSLENSITRIEIEANRISSTPFTLDFKPESIEKTTEGVKALQSTYQTLFDKMSEGKKDVDLAFLMSDIEDLKDNLKDADGQLQVSESTWNDFFDIMTDGSHSFEEMENALNKVLSEYVHGTISLQNFDKTQADALATQLELAGVTKESAEAYVDGMAQAAAAIENATNQGYDFINATWDEIDAEFKLADQSKVTAAEIIAYTLEKKAATGNTILTGADVDNLLTLANAAGIAAKSLVRYQEIKRDLDAAIKSGDTQRIRDVRLTLDTFTSQMDAAALAAEVRVSAASDRLEQSQDKARSNSKSGASKAAKEEEDLWKEAYEKELADLDHLHEMELISDASYYEEKNRLNEKYFANSDKYAEDYKKNQEDIYKGLKAAYKTYLDDSLDYYKKSLDAGIMSLQEYAKKAKGLLGDLLSLGKIDEATYYEDLANVYGTLIEQRDMAINSVQRGIDRQIKELEKEKKALNDDYDKRKEAIQAQIDEVQAVIDARNDEIESINDVIDGKNKQIKALNKEIKAKNKQIDAVNKEIKAKNKDIDELNAQVKVKNKEIDAINKEIKVRNKIIDGFQKQIDVIQDEIDVYQDEIDKLNEANKERQAAIEYQKALYELERAQNQRTSLVYNSEKGFVYEANDQDIKAAQEQLEDLKHEQAVAVLEKKISNLQDSIDVLNDKIEDVQDEIEVLNDRIEVLQDDIEILNERIEAIQDEIDELNKIIEAWQEEIDAINERIEELQDEIEILDEHIEVLEDEIEELEDVIDGFEAKINELETELDGLVAKIDEQIQKCEEYKEAWGEVANKFRESQEDMAAASLWGSNYMNDIRNQDKQLLETFTQEYIDLQKNQVDALRAAAEAKAKIYKDLENSLNEWKAAQAAAEQTHGSYSISSSNPVSGMKATATTAGKVTAPSASKSNNNSNPAKQYTPKTNYVATKINQQAKANNDKLAAHYKYGVGTKNAEEGIHEVAETGDEIIRDNYGNAYLAEGHQLHRFEGGERVYSPTETQELLKGKYVPIDSLIPNYADMVAKMMSSNIPSFGNVSNLNVPGYKGIPSSTTDKSISVTIGDIHVTEVDNAKQLATAITNNLPTALLQELTRK